MHLVVVEINHTLLGIPFKLMNLVLCRQERVYHLSLVYRLLHVEISRRMPIDFNCSKISVKLKRVSFLCDLFDLLVTLLIFSDIEHTHKHVQ